MRSRLFAALCAAGYCRTALGTPLGAPDSTLPQQDVVVVSSEDSATARPLKGRFLHITDIHPDPYYSVGSDPDRRCHSGHGDAGVWGAEITGCDTPWSLINETFRWIDQKLKNEIDFVVWTGDSARHDNDVDLPRSEKQIYGLNKQVAEKMFETFGKPDNIGDDDPTNDLIVPIVPNLGNNDVFPHNIMTPGPSKVTKAYMNIWKRFIPEDQYHTFQRGGYFWHQVVPGKNGKTGAASDGGLAVISLNTLYFFESNNAVDGCDAKSEPGYEQMEWLQAQLEVMRARNMKAILIGHVPPAWTSEKRSWDETCWKKYALFSKQFRDVLAGHIYGHMNLDHFILFDTKAMKPPHDIKKEKKKRKNKKHGKAMQVITNTFSGLMEPLSRFLPGLLGAKDDADMEQGVPEFDPEDDPVLSVQSAKSYLESLRDAFSYIPQLGASENEESENYKDALGGKWAERYVVTHVGPSVIPNYFPTLRVYSYNVTGLEKQGFSSTENEDFLLESQKKAGEGYENKKGKKGKSKKPAPPAKTAPPGPAYSMQPFTWIGYTQYYANITKSNMHTMNSPGLSTEIDSHKELKRDVETMKKGAVEYEIGYDTQKDKIYRLKDLTVRSYIDHARRIVDATMKSTKATSSDDEDDEDEDQYESDCGSDSSSDSDSDSDLAEIEKKKKKKKKKDKQKKKDRVWHAFVRRAMVGTVSDAELDSY